MSRRTPACIAAASCAWLALGALGCRVERDRDDAWLPIDRAEHPLAGLYTPGSKLGYEPVATTADASLGGLLSPEERMKLEGELAAAGEQDRCVPPAGASGTPGTLAVTFTSDTYGGFYAPANCGAVWIEDEDGQYVATVDVWAQMRLRNVFIWQGLRCKTEEIGLDVVSSATLETHEMHEVSWDGRDLNGKLVPDGPYVLNIEVTEDELNYGRRAEYPFEKGPEAQEQAPEDQESVLGLTMVWTPREEEAP